MWRSVVATTAAGYDRCGRGARFATPMHQARPDKKGIARGIASGFARKKLDLGPPVAAGGADDSALDYSVKSFSVAIARRSHPFPFRTRQLSSSAPMVLPWQRGGRVGRRRENPSKPLGSGKESSGFLVRPPAAPRRGDWPVLSAAAGVVNPVTRETIWTASCE